MKEIISIKGMHCRSCELLIEDKIKKISGVKKVFANLKKGEATIYTENGVPHSEIEKAVVEAGYQIGSENLPFFRGNPRDILFIASSAALISSIYVIAQKIGISDFLATYGPASTSLMAVFVIGITAGISTCMALVGGLVLGVSARHAEKYPEAKPMQNFRPHLFFNLGRIVSFILLGGVIGTIGSVFKLSSPVLGALTILVGLFMLFLGIQLLEMFPRFKLNLTIPKQIGNILRIKSHEEREYSHRNSVILGALTFFLPCGFTQAMQIYAMGTGSFVSGALIMGVFALGTTPGLLGIGGLTSIIKKGELAKLFFQFVGVLVIALSLYNLRNGFNLTGMSSFFGDKSATENIAGVDGNEAGSDKVNLSGNIKIFKAEYNPDNFSQTITPNEFNAKVGEEVRIEIFAKKDGVGCMGSVMIPGIVNEPAFFVKDETVVLSFTAKKTGKYKMTCAMGLQSGIITITK